MKYSVYKLDKRFSYNQWFEYYIGFPTRMSQSQGPLNFSKAQQWFFKTYGWSAEVRQYEDIYSWHALKMPMMAVKGGFTRATPAHLPEECNQHWSWSNNYDDLRIYIASDKELSFFQLAYPSDQL